MSLSAVITAKGIKIIILRKKRKAETTLSARAGKFSKFNNINSGT